MPKLQDMLGATARAIINQFPGVTIVYRLMVTAPNPTTGIKAGTFKDVTIPYVLKESVSVQDVLISGGGPVQMGDHKFTFSAQDIDDQIQFARSKMLTISDMLLFNGQLYQVVHVMKGTNEVLYTVFARSTGLTGSVALSGEVITP